MRDVTNEFVHHTIRFRNKEDAIKFNTAERGFGGTKLDHLCVYKYLSKPHKDGKGYVTVINPEWKDAPYELRYYEGAVPSVNYTISDSPCCGSKKEESIWAKFRKFLRER